MPSEPPYLGQGTRSSHTAETTARRWVWIVVQRTLFRWSPRPFHAFRAALLKLFGADIAEPSMVVIFPTAEVHFPWNLSLAPHSMVGPCVRIYNLGRISLLRGANVSQYCHLCSGSHDYLKWSMPLVTAPIVLGENCWLGADVFVGPGVTVGTLCVVGARSVVVRDLPDRTVCAGNPCKPAKERPAPG